MTRELFTKLGYVCQNVELCGFGGYSRDFLGFIDDLAFQDGFVIGLQSCMKSDVQRHRVKFQQLVDKKSIICEWMKGHELWLVWWTERKYPDGKSEWVPAIEVLNPGVYIEKKPPIPSELLAIVK